MNRSFFILILLLTIALPVYAKVVINEIAWMGTERSATDEWIELYSDSAESLKGWTLVTEDGGMKINLKGTTTPGSDGGVGTGGYYLIERTDDNAVQNIKADLIAPFGKGLSNDGEILILKDANGNHIDKVDGSNAWTIGGDIASKKTLQRNTSSPTGWITALATPKAENAQYTKPLPTPALQQKSTAPKSKSGPQIVNPKSTLNKNQRLASELSHDDFKEMNSSKFGLGSEYEWLLGGIFGGAVLGLIWVIIAKWKKSP